MAESTNKSKLINPDFKIPFWFYALLALGWLWMFIGYRVHPLYSVFLKLQLRFFRWRLRVRPDSLRLMNNVDGLCFAVLYDEKAAWLEFLPYLEKLKVKRRVQFAESLFYLFWINERFDEARQACHYWQNNAQSWIEKHEKESRQALHLLRKVSTWKPGYLENSKAKGFADLEIRQEADKLGGDWIKHYRNAQLAGFILDWLKQTDYAAAKEFLRHHKINRNPPFPSHYSFAPDFGYEVMQELGMDDNTFLKLCRKAEPFAQKG